MRIRSVVVIAVNLFFGLVIWILLCTNISFQSAMYDLLFPPLAALLALVTLIVCFKSSKGSRIKKLLTTSFLLPSLIGGGLYVAGLALLLMPLGFGLFEITNEVVIQKHPSPDNGQLAIVKFRAVGAYSGGNGRILVALRNRNIPLFEMDVHYRRVSQADESTADYLKWDGTDRLVTSEGDAVVGVGRLRIWWPSLFRLVDRSF